MQSNDHVPFCTFLEANLPILQKRDHEMHSFDDHLMNISLTNKVNVYAHVVCFVLYCGYEGPVFLCCRNCISNMCVSEQLYL